MEIHGDTRVQNPVALLFHSSLLLLPTLACSLLPDYCNKGCCGGDPAALVPPGVMVGALELPGLMVGALELPGLMVVAIELPAR
jgi:hypothetical protein